MTESARTTAVELATDLTIAWLGNQNNRIAANSVPTLLHMMHATVTQLVDGLAAKASGVAEGPTDTYIPAVTARKSLASKEHIISMIDGKPYRALRRHLSGHGLTPEQYRARYKLKADYPMVSESYSEARRAVALRIGLGRKDRATDVVPNVPSPARIKRAPLRLKMD